MDIAQIDGPATVRAGVAGGAGSGRPPGRMAELIKRATALAQAARAAAAAPKPEAWSGPRCEPAGCATWCLLAEAPGRPSASLQWLTPAISTLAQAMRCIPGDALRVVADMVEAGTLAVYRAQGPNLYAALVTDATVWRPADPGQEERLTRRRKPVPEPLPSNLAEVISRQNPTAAFILRSLVVDDFEPIGGEDWQPARPAVTAVEGRAGLARLLRQAASNQAYARLLDTLTLAVSVDQWAALVAARTHTDIPPEYVVTDVQQTSKALRLQTVPAGAQDKKQGAPGYLYTDAQRQCLVDAKAKAMNAGHMKYRKCILADWDVLMPGCKKPFASSLGRTIKRAEAAGFKPSNAPVSSVFDMGRGNTLKPITKQKQTARR